MADPLAPQTLEFENMSRVYDGMRESEFDHARFAAWCEGRTGYPMVVAGMRCLHVRGSIGIRMCAFARFVRGLPPVAALAAHVGVPHAPRLRLRARHPLPQFQMQSGLDGINTVRVDSQAKQVLDQDREGVFLRRWLPELAEVPREHLAEPQRMPLGVHRDVRCILREHDPQPTVEHASAYQSARQRVDGRKRAARSESAAVYAKHGSRHRPGTRARRARGTTKAQG